MATVLLLIAAAVCFLLDTVGVPGRRIAWTPLGLLLVTVVLIISAWPTEPFVVD